MKELHRAELQRRTIVVVILLTAMFAVSCAPKTLEPEAQKLFVAISIVDGLQALQSAAIDANKLQLVNDADSVQIVKFTKAAAITAANAPTGWKQTIVAGWDELVKVVPRDRVDKSQTLRILWISFATVIQQLRATPGGDVPAPEMVFPAALAAAMGV